MANPTDFNEKNIDLGLTALCVHARPGQTISIKDIAAVCNCSRRSIELILNSAKKKLRKKINLTHHLDS